MKDIDNYFSELMNIDFKYVLLYMDRQKELKKWWLDWDKLMEIDMETWEMNKLTLNKRQEIVEKLSGTITYEVKYK